MARKRREADVDNLESCLQDSSQNISVNGNETSVVVDGLSKDIQLRTIDAVTDAF